MLLKLVELVDTDNSKSWRWKTWPHFAQPAEHQSALVPI